MPPSWPLKNCCSCAGSIRPEPSILRVYPPHAGTTHAVEELLDPERVTVRRERDGYLDLLGDEDPTGHAPGQRLMVSRALPLVYERIWRPLGGRLLMGLMGPGMRGEHRIALEMLSLSAGDKVLDVACGPGNFTREFARAAGAGGLVVGLDASRTMLDRAEYKRRQAAPGVKITAKAFGRERRFPITNLFKA